MTAEPIEPFIQLKEAAAFLSMHEKTVQRKARTHKQNTPA